MFRSSYLLHCAFLVAALLLSVCVIAEAHQISPDTIRIDKVGGTALLTVEDDATCQARITALVSNPSIASVSPSDSSGVKVVFTVTGEKEGTTNILIGWKGFPAPDCIEDGGGSVHVIVCDKPKFPTTIQMGDSLTTTFSVTTTSECAFRVNASVAGGSLTGMSVIPGAQVTVSKSLPATFRINVDRNDPAFYRNIDIEWIGPSGQRESAVITVFRNSPAPVAPKTTAAAPSAGTSLDPINTATGEFFIRGPADLNLEGPIPLFFARSYGSFKRTDGIVADEIGTNWSHNFQWRLRRDGDVIVLVTSGGRHLSFRRAGTAWTLEGTHEAPFILIESNRVYRFADPRLQRIYQFDSLGMLRSISDGRGNALTLQYGAGGLLASISDGLGRSLTLNRDAGGQIIGVSDGGRTVRYEYLNRMLTRAIDASGNATTYEYDIGHAMMGLLARITAPDGNKVVAITYDAQGRAVTQTTDDGLRSTLRYDAGTTIVTDPVGTTLRHRHNPRNQLVAHTDQAGRSITIGVNASGQRELIVDRLGDSTRFGFDAKSGLVSSVTNPDGSTRQVTYTPRMVDGLTFYDLTSARDAAGASTSYTYDAMGNLTEGLDPGGNRWRYSYNTRGQVTSIVSPLGGTTTLIYNGDGTVASARDDAGNTTTYSYDPQRRLVSITAADGAVVRYEYDASDRLTTVTDERGSKTTLTYDRNDRPITAVDALTGTTRYQYDGLDRLMRITDPLGNIGRFTFDSLGRLSSLRDPLGNTATFRYDAAGRLTSHRDAEGLEQRRSVDAEGVVTGVTDPLGHRALFSSDRLGRLTELRTPLDAQVKYSYDAAGRVREVTDPLGEKAGYTYDQRGYATQLDLPENIAARYERNTIGQLSKIVDPNGSTWRYEYDRLGRRTSATDPLGNAGAFEYDSRSRVRRGTFPGGMGTVEITRDAAGAVTRLRFSDGTDLQYTYDALGRITSANGLTLAYDAAGRLTQSNGIALEYDSSSRITAMTLAQGKRVTYAYDRRGNVTAVRDWTGGVTSLAYDSAGRRTRIERPNGITTTTRHDAEGKPVEMRHGSAASIALSYNSRGEITSATRTGLLRPTLTPASQNLAYDAASQISGGGYQYDAIGRLVQAPGRSFTWDLASRLKSLGDGSRTISYSYDGAGNMLGRSEGASAQSFVWNLALGQPSISIERIGGSDTRFFVHTPGGELLYSIEGTGSARAFFHYNETEATILISDNAGAITDRYAYTPYGVMAGHEGTGTTPFTFLGASGVMQEPGTNLYFARARIYDASAGRFISREPLQFLSPRLLNQYQYAVGNPLRYVDVNGLEPEPPIEFRGVTETVNVTAASGAAIDVSITLPGHTPALQLIALPLPSSVRHLELVAPALTPRTASGIRLKGPIITLSHNAPDRRVFARLDAVVSPNKTPSPAGGTGPEVPLRSDMFIIDGIDEGGSRPSGVASGGGAGSAGVLSVLKGRNGNNFRISGDLATGLNIVIPAPARSGRSTIQPFGSPAGLRVSLFGTNVPGGPKPLFLLDGRFGEREAVNLKGPGSVDDDLDTDLGEKEIIQ